MLTGELLAILLDEVAKHGGATPVRVQVFNNAHPPSVQSAPAGLASAYFTRDPGDPGKRIFHISNY